jgi:hypothetical protein
MEEFFNQLYLNKPTDHWITIWTLRDKKTEWFQSVEGIKEYVENYDGDIFFGIGTSTTKHESNRRLSAKEIDGIGCLHLDIDFGVSGHKKENLPPDMKAAMQIAEMMIDPSYIISSGNGIHAYYLFENYYHTKEEVERVSDLLKDFQKMTDLYTPYSMDKTHDLSRVLRVPTSYNCKDVNNKKQCKIIRDNNEIRYSLDEIELSIEKFISSNKQVKETVGKYKEKDIFQQQIILLNKEHDDNPDEVIESEDHYEGEKLIFADIPTEEKYRILNRRLLRTPDRSLNPNKFYQLQDIYGLEFENVFHHKKKNKSEDSSCSAYDMKLANMAAKCGLDEQDICDLLISHRREYKQQNPMQNINLKLTHPDYYGRTIYKALIKEAMDKSNEEKKAIIASISDHSEEATPDAVDSQLRDMYLKYVSDAIGVKVIEFVKFEQEPEPTFQITIENNGEKKKIDLKQFNQCFNLGYFKSCIDKSIIGNPNFKCFQPIDKQQWDNIKKWLHEIATTKLLSPDMLEVPRIKSWIKEFMDTTNVKYELAEFENRAGETYVKDGELFFDEAQFFKYVKTNYEHKSKIQDIKIMLHNAGCTYRLIENNKISKTLAVHSLS